MSVAIAEFWKLAVESRLLGPADCRQLEAAFAHVKGAADQGNAASLGDIFEVAAAEGLLARISDSLFLHADWEAEMRRRVTQKLAAGGPGLTVAEIRDLLGTTRKYAVPLCEYLDRIGVTQRDGDIRTLAKELTEVSNPG